MAMSGGKTLDEIGNYQHPLYQVLSRAPGFSLGLAAVDDLLAWGLTNSLWVFPMATSCCGIELMTAAASRVDLDRMGTIVRGTPRQADVMVVAGTITVKMAPRVKKLWDQMPEPRFCIAMGSCAISGDFYRNLYSVVPGVDTFLPVDVYVPGCPPNPEALMHGLLRLQEKVARTRRGEKPVPDLRPELLELTRPSIPRLDDLARSPEQSAAQVDAADEATALQMTPMLTPLGRILRAGRQPTPALVPPAEESAASDVATLLTEFGVEPGREGPPLLPAARHLEFAQRLFALGYRQYVTVVASHWPAGLERKGKVAGAPEHFEVTTALRSIGKSSQVASWSVRLLPGESIPTLAPLFAGADWQEREQADLVGVIFLGHPDPRRLMMAENYVGHPLRRDFPSDAPAAPWR